MAVTRMRLWLAALTMAALAIPGAAQVPMPEVREMSGAPLPVGDLPDGTISVRVVRGTLSNNITDHPVELLRGAEVREARTDENGRAQFSGLPAGTMVTVRTVVDGESLESDAFASPARGGIRLMLVASGPGDAPAVETGVASRAGAAAPGGTGAPPEALVIGGQSRIVVEIGDEAVDVYYLFELINREPEPVAAGPLVFDMPTGARGTTVLQGSTPAAVVTGSRVTVTGDLPSGRTVLQTAYSLPYSGERLALTQVLPAPLEAPTVVVEKRDGMRVSSPQLAALREMSADGQAFIVGNGAAVPAGGSLALLLEGLPHHPKWPRTLTLALAVLVLAAGGWAAFSAGGPRPDARRRRLQSRRDRLFQELAQLEERRAMRPVEEPHYTLRRRDLVAQLERIYTELDEEAAA
jgi:hypothetical protein